MLANYRNALMAAFARPNPKRLVKVFYAHANPVTRFPTPQPEKQQTMPKLAQIDSPFEDGMDAYCEGYGREDCPYNLDSEEAGEWLAGWETSRDNDPLLDSLLSDLLVEDDDSDSIRAFDPDAL